MGLRKGTDADAVRIPQLDCASGEQRTALIGFDFVERRPNEVDHRDAVFSGCQMGRCTDRNLAFQHATDHTIHPVGFRHGADFEGLVNASGFHRINYAVLEPLGL